MKKLFLEEYGCILDKKPCKKNFNKVTNCGLLPKGGLWLSPLIGKDYKLITEWYLEAHNLNLFHNKYKNPKLYKIVLKMGVKVLYINKKDYDNGKYDDFISKEGKKRKLYLLDYERIAKEYDVIIFEFSRKGSSGYDFNSKYYKYDYKDFIYNLECNSAVVTNFDAIDNIIEMGEI